MVDETDPRCLNDVTKVTQQQKQDLNLDPLTSYTNVLFGSLKHSYFYQDLKGATSF